MMHSLNYDDVWSQMRLRPPQRWHTWETIEPYIKEEQSRLEIGTGVLPKFPIKDTYFLDTSASAIQKLQEQGGKGVVSDAASRFPFEDNTFDLVGTFETLEHLKHPEAAIREINRVLKSNGLFLFSVPIHQKYWSSWDKFAGHVQRFEPRELDRLLEKEGFLVEHCYNTLHPTKLTFLVFRYASWVCSPLFSYFPEFFFNFIFTPHAWIRRKIMKTRHYSTLRDMASDSANVFVVCGKQKRN